MFFASLSYTAFAQSEMKKADDFGLSVAINSIQAQVEIPLMTGGIGAITGIGAVAVDADGNIIARGNRVDNSYSCSIVPKYYINNDLLLRFEFGMTNLSLKANSDSKSAITHDISTEEVNSRIFRYTPGFQWIFMKKKKIESYCGMTVSYVNHKDVNINYYDESKDLATDTVQSWVNRKEATHGGFALGIGALAGFNR